MSFRPSIELVVVVLLLIFLAVGFRVLTNPGKYFPEATPHAGQAFTELAVVAGPTGVRGKRDARGEDAEFNAPRAITFDHAGSLYVLDTGNHALRKVEPDATVSTLADLTGEVGPQRGDYPDGIAVDNQGSVYIAEADNEVILKVTATGQASVFAGQRGVAGLSDGAGAAARFSGPSGLAIDNAGNLFVADSGNNAIRRITPAGVVSTLAGGAAGNADGALAKARFAGPWGLALAADGTLFVAEMHTVEKDGKAQAATAIRRISPSGTVSTLAENALYTPPPGQHKNIILLNAATAIALDGSGDLLYLRQGNIQRLHMEHGVVGDTPLNPVQSTLHPAPQALAGIAIDKHGSIFVADADNDYLVKVDAQLSFSTFAGTSQFVGGAGHQGPIAGLDTPLLARTDAAGNIYVLYDGYRYIRKLTPDLQISGALNRFVDDGSIKASQPLPPGPQPIKPGTARLFRVVDLEKALGFHFFSFDIPADGSYTVTPIGNSFAVDGQQNLYIPSLCGAKNTGCVVRVTPSGGAEVVANGYTNIQDIQLDSTGNIYIYDAVSGKRRTGKRWVDHIIVLRHNGEFVHAFELEMPAGATVMSKGHKTATAGNHETALAIAANGDMVIADQSSVRRLTPAGAVSTVAGSSTASGYLDAQGAAARFNQINGLAFGKNGEIYVSEGANNAVRQIASDGTVSTVVNYQGAGIIHYDPGKTGALDQLHGLAGLPDGNLVLLNHYTILRTQ